ncbi:hypothetical protein T01_6492 [Trichinella spiralis]|uniref:Uncharacterized protein n=1 Tax=Trichinella spiralis TaxID=6334 RepID=A0A0V0YWX5_TRISP|nr:hypothetical protein T01_6492 [Trichinella spiralis]
MNFMNNVTKRDDEIYYVFIYTLHITTALLCKFDELNLAD